MIDKILENHKLIKELARDLSEGGIIVNVRYQGKVVAKAGKGVSPFMMGIVGDVEVVDMESAMKLADSLGII